MKKQVLSFTEFINEAYNIVNEAIKTRSWEQVKLFFSNNDYLNSDELKILADIETTLKSDDRDGVTEGETINKISSYFGSIIIDQLGGQYLNIDSVSASVDDIEHDKCIMGMFQVTKKGSPIGQEIKILDPDSEKPLEFGTFPDVASGFMKISDFLNMVNILNMGKLGNENVIKLNKKGKAEFDEIEKEERGRKDKGKGWGGFVGLFYRKFNNTKIEGSGSQNNYFITQATDNIEIQKWTDASRIKPLVGSATGLSVDKGTTAAPIMGALTGAMKDSSGKTTASRRIKKAGEATFQFVLYSMSSKAYKKGGGTKFYSNDVSMVKVPVKGKDKVQTLVINDPDSLIFTVGSTAITASGKQKIYTYIMNEFSTVSSIEITGYASAEGTDVNNLRLCKGRADSAKEFLDEYFGGVTVVNGEVPTDAAGIAGEMKKYVQPKSEVEGKTGKAKEDAYKPWRKISLKITGSKVIPGETYEETKEIKVVDKIKYDKVTLKQITIDITVQLEAKYANKKSLVGKRGKNVRGGTNAGTEPRKYKSDESENDE